MKINDLSKGLLSNEHLRLKRSKDVRYEKACNVCVLVLSGLREVCKSDQVSCVV